jgi:hypothetical protein
MSLKMAMKNSASRGENRARRAIKQGIRAI